jgi:sulfur-carrier protein
MERFKIKAFGMLAEKLPAQEFDFPVYSDTEELLKKLEQEYPQLQGMKYSLAIDKQVVHDKQALNGNEEIALLPPFSGG